MWSVDRERQNEGIDTLRKQNKLLFLLQENGQRWIALETMVKFSSCQVYQLELCLFPMAAMNGVREGKRIELGCVVE